MHVSFRWAILASTAILGLGGFAAQAASPPPGAPAAIAVRAPATGHDLAGRVEQRIVELRASLKITPAQLPQWDRFTAVMRENVQGMDQAFQHRVVGMEKMNAADNMRSYAAMSMEHAQGMQRLVPAFDALYMTMSDEQKRVADEEFVDRAHHGSEQPKG
jgi:periplasmic protein CpxP/Spy